jgi:hypothetical protein
MATPIPTSRDTGRSRTILSLHWCLYDGQVTIPNYRRKNQYCTKSCGELKGTVTPAISSAIAAGLTELINCTLHYIRINFIITVAFEHILVRINATV